MAVEMLLYYKPGADLTQPADPGRAWGDILCVLPAASAWGRSECLEDFLVVRVEGVEPCEAAHLVEQLLVEPLTGVYAHCLSSVSEILATYEAAGQQIRLHVAQHSRYALDMGRLDYDEVARAYAENWYTPTLTATDFWAALIDKAARA